MKQTNHSVEHEQQNLELARKLKTLDKKLQAAQSERDKVKQIFYNLDGQYNQLLNSSLWRMTKIPHKAKSFARTAGAYLLGRRNRKQLYSKSYKRKKAENELKHYKKYLYNFGFTEKALADLEKLYSDTNNRYLKRAIAWELTLWYANKYCKDGAIQALKYVTDAVTDGDEPERIRRAAIIKAECFDILMQQKKGKEIIHSLLHTQPHPDLYLAAANLETDTKERLHWINKALSMYDLQPVTINNSTYDSIETVSTNEKIKSGPKVTVIVPAYNAEGGIGTAIESLLVQTWSNLEIIIVDDCSTDQTLSVVKSYIEKDSRIRMLSTKENSGPYIARNIALKTATGDFITINDSDDWSHAQKIEIQAKHLMENENVIANTSQLARLTENLKFYRRGTPGTYIFSNMSSLMFRREPVIESAGYWDSVRFAADSEYKRRITGIFGESSITELKTGPLSFPRQSAASLTGNSAFGYNGFLMGVRKEYAEVHRAYHKEADTLFYPFPQEKRPFPVPEPMWPEREKKVMGFRQFDVIIMTDFRLPDEMLKSTIEEINTQKEKGLRTGLIQKSCYHFKLPSAINSNLRKTLDGDKVQMLFYGEKAQCDLLIVKYPVILTEMERYLPEIETKSILVVMDPAIEGDYNQNYDVRIFSRNLAEYAGKMGKWYTVNDKAKKSLLKQPHMKSINLAIDNWNDENNSKREEYIMRLEDWLVDKNWSGKG